jgi:WD40 repeat protein
VTAVDRSGEGRPGRFLFAAGTGRYAHLPQLESVPDEVDRITSLFESIGAESVLGTDGRDPTSDGLRSKLEDWLHGPERNPSDVLVIYYSGHGVVGPDAMYYLCTTDSHPDRLVSTAVPAGQLAGLLAGSGVRNILVILDACYAGQGNEDGLLAALRAISFQPADMDGGTGTGLWFVATARRLEEAAQGAFVAALSEVIHNEAVGGPKQQYLDPGTVVGQINRQLRSAGLAQRAVQASINVTGPCLPLPNPRYVPTLPEGISISEQRRVLGDLEHWEPRARGLATEADAGWHFTGRHRALSDLIAHLIGETDQRVCVVTGDPGSGKSAVLSRIVTTADPAVRGRIPPSALGSAPTMPVGAINAAFVARGKTLHQLTREFATVAGIDTEDPRRLLEFLRERRTALTVVIDSLDESAEPELMARALVAPFARADDAGGLRLAVGTRRNLLSQIGTGFQIVDLDDAMYLEPADLARYAERLLLSAPRSPYSGDPEAARRTAEAIAAKAGHTFLIARVYAQSLSMAAEQVDVTSAAWQRQPAELGAVFDAELARQGPDATWTRDLLRPLAYAEGTGLPWAGIWVAIASAIAHRTFTDDDIRYLMDVAGAYIVESVEDGQTVYRLYHQAFAEHLRLPHEGADIQARITGVLVGLVPIDRVGHRDWSAADRYIRTHLSAHAAAAGQLDNLVTDPGFLLSADVQHLVRALPTVVSQPAVKAADAYQRAARHVSRRVAESGAYLQLFARCQGAEALADALADDRFALPWKAEWANWTPATPHRVIDTGSAVIKAVDTVVLDGRQVAVTGGEDAMVRVWDLETAAEILSLSGHNGWIYAVATAVLDEQPVAVSGGADGSMHVWDLTLGNRLTGMSGDQGAVVDLATTVVDGRPVVISADGTGTLFIWDLTKGARRYLGTFGAVSSIAATVIEGRPFVVAVDHRREAFLVKLVDDSDYWPNLIPDLPGPATDVATAVLDGHSVALISCRDPSVEKYTGERVLVVNLENGRTMRELRGHDVYPVAVTTASLRGRLIALVADLSHEVHVWDIQNGQRIGRLVGHSGPVEAISVTTLAGRTVGLTVARDLTLRIWDLAALHRPEERPKRVGHTHVVATGTDGERPIVVCGGDDNLVRVLDFRTGAEVASMTGHTDFVFGAHLVSIDGRPAALTRSRDQSIRVWDLRERAQIAVIDCHEWGSVVPTTVNDGLILLTGGRQGGITAWHLPSMNKIRSLRTRDWDISELIAIPTETDTVVAAVDGGESVKLWSLTTGKRCGALSDRWQRLRGRPRLLARLWPGRHPKHPAVDDRWHASRYLAAAVIGGRPHVLTGGGQTFRVWDLRTRKQTGFFPSHGYAIRAHSITVIGGAPVLLWTMFAGVGGGAEVLHLQDLTRLYPTRPRKLYRNDLDDRGYRNISVDAEIEGIAAGPEGWLVLGTDKGVVTLHVGAVFGRS